MRAFFGCDLRADASIGPTGSKLSACSDEKTPAGGYGIRPLPIRQSVSYLWYFIPALIVQAR